MDVLKNNAHYYNVKIIAMKLLNQIFIIVQMDKYLTLNARYSVLEIEFIIFVKVLYKNVKINVNIINVSMNVNSIKEVYVQMEIFILNNAIKFVVKN